MLSSECPLYWEIGGFAISETEAPFASQLGGNSLHALTHLFYSRYNDEKEEEGRKIRSKTIFFT